MTAQGALSDGSRSNLLSTLGTMLLSAPMIGENRQLVTDEQVEVQDCRKITDRFREIYRIYPNSIRGKPEDMNL